jgi:hypothetical protein
VYFFTFAAVQDLQSTNYTGHFLGWDGEEIYPANTLIGAIAKYALMRQIDTGISVNDFFGVLYKSYELEVTESKSNIPWTQTLHKLWKLQFFHGNQQLLTPDGCSQNPHPTTIV